jgi:hypothetical protein
LISEVFAYTPPPEVRAEDDIALSAAVSIATGSNAVRAAMPSGYVERAILRENALCERPDHYERRDDACLWWRDRGWRWISDGE